MFSKKLLLKTFGAKIKPYGFEFAGYVCRRYTFSRVMDGREQTFVIQNDPGGHSLQLEIETHAGRIEEIRELFWDLDYHCYWNSEELENILNLLGDHVVSRVIPRLPELSIPRQEYAHKVTEEMYGRLEQKKEELVRNFLEEEWIDRIQGTDMLMVRVIREVERIRELPYEEMVEDLIKLAAVYGHIIIRDIGGEWIRRRWLRARHPPLEFIIGHCPFQDESEDPLKTVSECCQKGGGTRLAEKYMALVKKHRGNIARERKKYGDDWQPPKTSNVVDESLMSESIIKEALAGKLENIGFSYDRQSEYPGNYFCWWVERKQQKEEMYIMIKEEPCRRQTFFISLSRSMEGRTEEYMYRRFFSYQDEEEMRRQLGRAGEEMMEAIREDRRVTDLSKGSKSCSVTEEMKESFRLGREEMAERFLKRNGLDAASREADILHCIVEEMDSIKVDGYKENSRMLDAFYEANQEQLMELSAAYGELICREIGGCWSEDEEWRMWHRGAFLQDVPVISRVVLPDALIRHWENEGSAGLLREYQEYKWLYGEWRRLCRMAGIEAG